MTQKSAILDASPEVLMKICLSHATAKVAKSTLGGPEIAEKT